MSDEVDISNDKAEQLLQAKIAELRRQSESKLQPTGACLNCEEPAPENQVFCTADCRDDYQRRASRNSRK